LKPSARERFVGHFSSPLAASILVKAGSPPGLGERIVVEHASPYSFSIWRPANFLKDVPTLKHPHEMVVDPEAGVAYVSIAYKDGPWDQYESPGNP